MAIVFATNDHADFPGSILDTDTANRRTAYVSEAFKVATGDNNNSFVRGTTTLPEVAGDITWIHFQYRRNKTLGGSFADGTSMFKMLSVTGVQIMSFDVQDGQLRAILNGSSNKTTRVTGDFDGTSLRAFDMKIDLTSDITVEIYDDQVLVHDESQAWTSSPGNPGFLQWRVQDASNGADDNQYVSEFIVADEDTRNFGLSEMKPNAAGNYSAWNGDHVETGDTDLGTGASSSSTGQKLSSVMSSFGGPSSSALRALVINNKASTRGGTVGDLRNFLRIGGADFNGAAMGVNETIKHHTTVFNTNPDTAADWDTTDFSGVEVGIESLA